MIIEICSQNRALEEVANMRTGEPVSIISIVSSDEKDVEFDSSSLNDKGTVLLTTFASKVVRRTVPLSTFLSSAMIYEEHKKGACAGRLRTGSRPGP